MARYHQNLETPQQVQSAAQSLLGEVRDIGDVVYPQYIRIITTRRLLSECSMVDFSERDELEEWQHPVNSDVVSRIESASVVDIHINGAMMKVHLMPFPAPSTYRGIWENLVGQSLPSITPMAALLWTDSSRSIADKMELSLRMIDSTDTVFSDIVDVDSTTKESAAAALAAYEDGVPLSWAVEMITGSGRRKVTNRWIGKA